MSATTRRRAPAATSEPKLDGDAIASMPNQRKTSPSPFLIALVGGLLSSSCCVIQLALNALAFGCAGFAALDKFRAPAAAATAAALLASERTRRREGRKGREKKTSSLLSLRALLPFALAGILAASPEITAAVSRAGGLSGAVARAKEFAFEFSSKPSSFFCSEASFSGSSRKPTTAVSAVVVKKLRLTGVKCAACGERARAAAAGAAGPFGAEVSVDWLKKEATVKIPPSSFSGGKGGECSQEKEAAVRGSVLSGMINALSEAGFGAAAAEEEES